MSGSKRKRLILGLVLFSMWAAGTLVTIWRSPVVRLVDGDVHVNWNGAFIVLHPPGVALMFAAEAVLSFVTAHVILSLLGQVQAKPRHP